MDTDNPASSPGTVPTIALLGAGLFVRDQYVNILNGLVGSGRVEVKYVWSRSEAAAKDVAAKFGSALPRFGESGLDEILMDEHVHAVAVVLPAQVQPAVVRRALKAGKHVIQEKPVGASVSEALETLSAYKELHASGRKGLIWGVAENYRFEPALIEAARRVKEDMGRVMMAEVVVEAPMNGKNPYFSSPWRRDPMFSGAFLVDGGVHFMAGLRLILGCEPVTVSSFSSHADPSLPPPDNIASALSFENGAIGVMMMSYSSTSRKVSWRVVGEKGTVEVERGIDGGKHGYSTTFYAPGEATQRVFYPFEGVQKELESFIADVQTALTKEICKTDTRYSPLEAIKDLSSVEAMVISGSTKGLVQTVERFI